MSDGPIVYTPLYIPKPVEDEIDTSKILGMPGTIDLDGLYIPEKIIKNNPFKPVKHRRGKIRIAPRRSFYSGEFYGKKSTLEAADKRYKNSCSNPTLRVKFALADLHRKYKDEDPLVARAKEKYKAYKKKLGQSRGPRFLREFTEGYLAVNGEYTVKKVLKEREDALNSEEIIVPETGVVVLGAENHD